MFDNAVMPFYGCRVQFRGPACAGWTIEGDPSPVDEQDPLPVGQPFVFGRVSNDSLGSHARMFFDGDLSEIFSWFTGRTIDLRINVDSLPEPAPLRVQLVSLVSARLAGGGLHEQSLKIAYEASVFTRQLHTFCAQVGPILAELEGAGLINDPDFRQLPDGLRSLKCK